MPYAYNTPITPGSPWLDYKESTKSSRELFFVFRIENFLYFILREICITYPANNLLGRPQLPLKVTVQAASTVLQVIPREVPPQLFSSPSENFRRGTLGDRPNGQRLQTIVFNYPCDLGDTIFVNIVGDATGFLLGCMLTGRKFYKGDVWL